MTRELVITHLAAATANCKAGSWAQRWKCGWNAPTTTASHVGYTFGHSVLPVLLIVAVIAVVAIWLRGRRTRAGQSGSLPARRPSARGGGNP